MESGGSVAYARATNEERYCVAKPVQFCGFDNLDLNCAPASVSGSSSHVEPVDICESTLMQDVNQLLLSSSNCLMGLERNEPVGEGTIGSSHRLMDGKQNDCTPDFQPGTSNHSTIGEHNETVLEEQPRQIIPAVNLLDLNVVPSLSGSGSTSAENGDVAIRTAIDSSNESHSQPLVPCAWKKRNCVGKGPDRREKTYVKASALEQALMKFADRSSDYIISPDIGTEFDDSDEAFEYYNLYSWECGFGIRYGNKRYSDNRENRKLPIEERYQLGQEFVCSCAGRPVQGLKKTSSRTNCPARLRLGRTSDHGWIVVEHVADHNHPMTTTYGEKKHWPSHSRLDKYTKDLVRMLRQNNIGITKLYSILGTFFGKMENVPTTKRCLKTLCQKINREQADDDIKKTLTLFSQFMKDDPGFKYIVDPDEEGRIKTLMWTNSRSIMQYQHFGDAITFDTTYKTNLYEMPFGLFVGVNNHFQSVLLGGVLMTDETIESFEWVFTKFASLMGGKEPMTILTDQCRAMEVALGNVWKNTQHRWCKWHVLKRLAECLGQKYTQNRDFRDKFHKLLNEMMTTEEFDAAWGALLLEYGLEDNGFLKQIFATRAKWVKSYFKGVFCARMASTQRSESANMMLKNIVPPSCPLNVFVEQYEVRVQI